MTLVSAPPAPIEELPGESVAHVAPAVPERSRWRYPADPESRDLRIDFLRGLAILFVVVDHIELNSAFYILSHERIGVVTGAELFVLLSGVVLGMVHRRRAITAGWSSSASRMWGRAKLLYVVSLIVVIAAYLLSFVPFLDGDVLTTWTDVVTGTTYDLYGSTPLLTEYPVPPPAVFDILFLDVGPFQFNVMGLYVALLLIAPLLFRLLLTGKWWLLLALSMAAYTANLFLHWRIVPSSFANQFPFLSWQLLFVLGLIAGFFSTALRDWFKRPAGKALVTIAAMAVVLFAVFSWANPDKLGDPWALRLDLVSAGRFYDIYEQWFRRDFLGPLRVVNVLVIAVAFYAILTRFWVPLNRTLGWLLVPLGGATLYVFIMHVVLNLLVVSLPFVDRASLAVGTLTHAAVLLVLWAMVRSKFLFRWIPR